ncbi:MAG: hypothetical protein WAS54_03550 [Scrofimicrobium sp.]
MDSWLPSEQLWINEIAEMLLEGDIVLLRALPRWGLSTVCRSLQATFGESSVLINGRSITEENQSSIRDQISVDVKTALDSNGYAQLIFDDYGTAIRRSQGGALHSMLYRMLIDAESARDTGALLVARSGDTLDLRFSGSPLISRARTVALPVLDIDDSKYLEWGLDDLRSVVGESTWLARKFSQATRRQGEVDATEHLRNNRRRIVEQLSPEAVEVITGNRQIQDVGIRSREDLRCLGTDKDGAFKLSTLASDSGLEGEVSSRNPGWPANLADSVIRFGELLAGAEDVIWVDRYLFSKPEQVRAFLDKLRQLTRTKIRFLVSDDRDRPDFANQISSSLIGLENVSVRFMNRADRRLLHDRHLIIPAFRSGFVLPTAGVILGSDAPGSAVSVAMPALAINYAECWSRGCQVWPQK